MFIESFETSKTAVYGDLLGARRPDKELKVGFLAGAYFEYYRMWGEGYARQIQADMDLVAANLRKRFKNVIYPGLCDTMDKCARAGEIFKQEEVDVVVLCQGTYFPDYMPLEALGHVKDAALIIFSTQSEPIIRQDIDYPQVIRDSALIGLVQLTGALRKMGWFPNYRPVVGWLDDQEAYDKIARYANAAIAHKNLQHKNIGVVGHVFRGMYDFEHDKTKVKGKLGPNCINIQVSHLVDLWDAVNEQEVAAVEADVRRRFRVRDLDQTDIHKAARLAIAMKDLVNRFNLDALCYLGQHHVEQKTQTTAYLGSALLQESGVMTISEGDVHGVTMMMLQHLLTGQTPFFGEWGGFDEALNAILIEMHGFADPQIAKDPNEIWVTSSPENWGYSGNGFSFEFTAKPGVATIGHMIDDLDGYRMIIAKGEILDLPALPIREVNFRMRMEKPVKQLLVELLNHGFAHHTIVAYGDLTEELSYVADLMGIRKVQL
jgi:L-arabinose isomerase